MMMMMAMTKAGDIDYDVVGWLAGALIPLTVFSVHWHCGLIQLLTTTSTPQSWSC